MSLRVWFIVGVGVVGGAALLASIPNEITLATLPTEPPPATTTPAAISLSATTTPKTATSTTPAKPVAKSAPAAKPKDTGLMVSVSNTVAHPSQSDFETAAATVKAALVNILCYSGRSDISSISGSGVIIDPRGIVLTNAHIANYFLLAGDPAYDVSCTLRTGSPARDAYKASLMFISPTWVAANAHFLTEQNPTGNGEYDFAFLAITGATKGVPYPESFPFIPLAGSDAYPGEPVIIGSYGAQFLTTSEIQTTLYPILVYGLVKDIFTFVERTIDVVALGGSAAAQEGSSGGGIALGDSTLGGIITTSTVEGETASRVLSGITVSYIRRDYRTESGSSLEELLAKSPIGAAADFAPQIAPLRTTLTAQLPH